MGPITEDICLGNRNNTTSSKEFMDKCYEAFESEGFNTVKNKVFIGGYITKRYAIKDMVETLQIELRYTNYIEAHELDIRKAPRLDSNLFYETSFRLEKVMEKIGVEKREQEKVRIVVENSHIWKKRVFILLFAVALILAFFEGNIS
jgi:N-formylglutamate amidohydrolase